MGQITGLTEFAVNTVIVSADMNGNFENVQDTYNVHDIATTGVHGATAATGVLAYANQLTPLGAIIAHYDFDGALTYDGDYWAVCNGQSKTISGSSRTLPDLSNRYLVGFGTEGEEDNGSAAWATAAVGVASHQVDLSHTHTVDSHNHKWAQQTIGSITTSYQSDGSTSVHIISQRVTDGANSYCWEQRTVTAGYYTNNATPGTDSQLSATQSIQPRSIRVRWIMRIL